MPVGIAIVAILAVILAASIVLANRRADAAGLPAFKAVAPGGSDRNSGNLDAPWGSLAYAIANTQPGTILSIQGTWTANDLALNVENKNGSANSHLVIWGGDPTNPGKIVGRGGYEVVRVANSSYVDIIGLEIEGVANTDSSKLNSGISVDDSHHVRVASNRVHDVGGGGIATNNSNHVRIENNSVSGTSRWSFYQTSAISFYMSSNLGGADNGDGYSNYAIGNVAWGNYTQTPGPDGEITDGNCMIVDRGRDSGYRGSTLVMNNVCVNNGGRGLDVFKSDNVMAVNNTFVNNLQALPDPCCEIAANEASNVVFRNNLIKPGKATASPMAWASSGVTFDHNVYIASSAQNKSATDVLAPNAALAFGVVPAAGNPAINGGNAYGAPGNDLAGNARIGAPDVGAIEVG
jgi:parallel beta-helix repeat protein